MNLKCSEACHHQSDGKTGWQAGAPHIHPTAETPATPTPTTICVSNSDQQSTTEPAATADRHIEVSTVGPLGVIGMWAATAGRRVGRLTAAVTGRARFQYECLSTS